MEHYSHSEYADMLLIYGQALGNCVEARRIYSDRFPNRRLPHRRTFERVDRSFRETGSLLSHRCGEGPPTRARNPQLEEEILCKKAVGPSSCDRVGCSGDPSRTTATSLSRPKGHISSFIKTVRMHIFASAAQYPISALTLVIISSCAFLPLVSAAALMPIVAIIYVGDYLESKGLLSMIYTICFQGLLLAVTLTVLSSITFIIATGANILHSKYYPSTKAKTNYSLDSKQQKIVW